MQKKVSKLLALFFVLAFTHAQAAKFDVETANLALFYTGQAVRVSWDHPGGVFTSYELQLKSYERDFIEWVVVLPESATSHKMVLPKTGHYYIALRTVFDTPMGAVNSPWVHSNLNGKEATDLNGTVHPGPWWLHGGLAPPGPIQ